MKVLMQSRVSLFKVLGGDTIQILKTKEYLEKLGIKVDISTELQPNLKEYDLVHLFNLIRPQEIYLQAKNAKSQGKKVILSPIYVLYTEYDRKGREGLAKLSANLLSSGQIEYLKVLGRAVENREFHRGTLIFLMNGYRRLQKKILNLVDFLLPNSHSEMNRIIEDFGLKNFPYLVVPNAVGKDLFRNKDIKINKELEKFRNCVLCVARIEGCKNQLNVVRAIKKLPYTLVLVGKVAPNHKGYFAHIKKEVTKNVYLLGERDSFFLSQLYSLAKVHVLASWFETTGLSSLEAGIMGCNLVITDKGDTKEYFSDYAYYCEPDSVESIIQAIIKAYESPVNPELREYILENFTWEKTAEKTLGAYQSIIRQKVELFR